jgi:hypothetical protein
MRRFLIILGVIPLALGVIGLVQPTFNYHQQEEVAKIGPIKATVDEQKTAQIPPLLSISFQPSTLVEPARHAHVERSTAAPK